MSTTKQSITVIQYSEEYCVTKAVNTLHPRVGSYLKEEEVKNLIRTGMHVTVIPPVRK